MQTSLVVKLQTSLWESENHVTTMTRLLSNQETYSMLREQIQKSYRDWLTHGNVLTINRIRYRIAGIIGVLEITGRILRWLVWKTVNKYKNKQNTISNILSVLDTLTRFPEKELSRSGINMSLVHSTQVEGRMLTKIRFNKSSQSA